MPATGEAFIYPTMQADELKLRSFGMMGKPASQASPVLLNS